jgi:hypothetical protein
MRKKIIAILTVLISVLITFSLPAEGTWINSEDSPIQFFFETERGIISILSHTYQVGADEGEDFNFRTQGGQEILYPFERYAIGAELFDAHRVVFTYQPLQLVTNVTFREEVTIDGIRFPKNTPMELSYGFPFYRLTYTYDLLKDDPDRVLGVGGALQLRNASIKFEALQDTGEEKNLAVSQNLGPVPAISIYSRWNLPSGLILSADITGLYTNLAFINGADFAFEGSILDASLRAGYELANGSEVFGNLRFFGGTAKGKSEYPDTFWTKSEGDFTKNNIASMTVSLGAALR